MSNRSNNSFCLPGRVLNCNNYSAGPLLPALLFTSFAFVAPKVLVMDDEARLRPWKRHTEVLLVIHERVEMVMLRTHSRTPHGVLKVLRQFARVIAALRGSEDPLNSLV